MKRRILLAEDDLDDQLFFTAFLQNRNDIITMPIAENGEVLFDILQGIDEYEALPDLILLDQNMPKMNGLQALQRLKADRRYTDIPVAIYSTYTDEAFIKNGVQFGACEVLPKPVTKAGYDKMIDLLFHKCLKQK